MAFWPPRVLVPQAGSGKGMSWKLRWGWARHGTNIQTTAHKETRKEEDERGCRRLHQDPIVLHWQRVERWRRGESESPRSLSPRLSWGDSSRACCGPEGEGARPVNGGQEGRQPRLPLRLWALPPYTTPWDMLLRPVESDVVDGPEWVGVRDSSSIMPREWAVLWAWLPPPARLWTHPRLDVLA